jgi:hypothetical protein
VQEAPPFTEDQADTLLAAAENLTPAIQHLLHTIQVCEPEVLELPDPDIKQVVFQDLTTLKYAMQAFVMGVLEKVPVSFFRFS